MYTVLQAGRAFCYTVGKNLDLLGAEHVRQVRKDCASVILWCAEKATWMAGEGIQIFGGNGYINEYPLGRLWRDAKLYEIGAGTQRDPPHADRPRAVRRDDVNASPDLKTCSTTTAAGPPPPSSASRASSPAWRSSRPAVHVDRLRRQPRAGQRDHRPRPRRGLRAPQRGQRGGALRPERAVDHPVRGRAPQGRAHHRRRPLRLRRRARGDAAAPASAWPTTGCATCRTCAAPPQAAGPPAAEPSRKTSCAR